MLWLFQWLYISQYTSETLYALFCIKLDKKKIEIVYSQLDSIEAQLYLNYTLYN